MVRLRANFDGGPDGAAITNANSGQIPGNDALDFIQGAGTGLVFGYASVGLNNLNRPTAEYVMNIDTGTNISASPGVAWSTSFGPITQIWTRFYVYFTTLGNTNGSAALFSIMRDNAVLTAGGVTLFINGASPFQFVLYNNKTAAQVGGSFTPTVNTWNRIEMNVIMGTASGSTEVYVYSGDDSDTDTYSDYMTQTSQDYGGTSATYVCLGEIIQAPTRGAATYWSGWEVNDTGYPGPAPFRQGLGYPSGNLTNPIAIHVN